MAFEFLLIAGCEGAF